MDSDKDEEKLLQSVALQNARAVLLARERVERELNETKQVLEQRTEELSHQREWFQVTLSSIGDAVITTDLQGKVTFLNPVAEKMTGWKMVEATGQPLETVFKIINEETRLHIDNPIAKVLREGVVVGLANHTALIAQDGNEIPVEDSAAPIRDASGKISGAVMVFHDVTERRKAERMLRENADQIRATFDQAAVGMATASLDGRLQQTNQKFSDILGYSAEELHLRTFGDLTHPEDLSVTEKVMQRLLAGEIRDYSLEKRYLRKDGRTIWTLSTVTLLKDSAGRPQRFICVVEDISQRKEAEEAKFRLAAVVESSDDAIISKTLEGIITSWNQGAQRMYGYTAREAIGKPVTILIPPHLLDEEPAIIARLKRGERIEHYETIRQRKDGSLLDVALTVSPIRDATGKIIGASKIARDITERKRAEEANARLAAVVESSDDAIISKTLDGIITTWNQGAQRMYGYTAREIIGKPVTILIPAHLSDEEPAIINRLKRGERIEHYETVRQRKDGSLLDVALTVSPLRDASGKIIGASKIARDITERKRAEEAKFRLAAVVQSSDDAIISKTLEGIITSWNEGAKRMYGYTAEEMIGKSVMILIPPHLVDEETLTLARLKRGEPIEHYDTVRQRKDGTLLDVSLTVSPIKDASGKIVGASKIARDITERKRSEEALREAQEKLNRHAKDLEKEVAQRTAHLQDSIQSLESLCYTIAHDLRAPLRAVQGFTKIILEDYAPAFDDTGKQFAERIVVSAMRMDTLIRDLLDYAKLSHVDLPCVNLDLKIVAQTILRNMSSEIEAAKAQVILQPLPVVWANQTLCEQIFANLLGNSLKFVEDGVTPKIEISAGKKEDFVRLSVRDNGIGIRPQYHERVFGMFQRLHGDEKKYPGTGVGLAIVKKGMERMGGRVAIDSSVTSGTCFHLDFRFAKGTR